MAKQFVGIRLDAELVAAAENVAASERRSLSNYVLTLIAEDLARRKAGIVVKGDPNAHVSAIPSLVDAIKEQTATINKLLERNAEAPVLRALPAPETAGATHASGRKKRAQGH